MLNRQEKTEIDRNATKGVWTDYWLDSISKNKVFRLQEKGFRCGLYRPFVQSNFYFEYQLNTRQYQLTKLFPTPKTKNKIIVVSGKGASKEHTLFISNNIIDLNSLNAGAQCFPLYWYEENKQKGLFEQEEDDYICHDGISDWMLKEVRNRIGNKKITKEMIFYYIISMVCYILLTIAKPLHRI